jgi:hypothetical protein
LPGYPIARLTGGEPLRLALTSGDEELREYIMRTVKGKEARHHIGEP